MATTTVPDVRTASMTDTPVRPDLVVGDDGRARCWWGAGDPLYVAYHDDEWGRPLRDEHALFGLLCLEFFQSGLSWLTILRKRPAFFAAFDGFDPEVVAGYGDAEVARLMADAGIVRNRQDRRRHRQRRGARRHARAGRDAGRPAVLVRARARRRPSGPTAGSAPWPRSRRARRRPRRCPRRSRPGGSASSGPVVAYALMQSAGIVDDHLEGCWVNG